MRWSVIAIVLGLLTLCLPMEVSADELDAEAAAAVDVGPQEAQEEAPPATAPEASGWSDIGWRIAEYLVPVVASFLTVLLGFAIRWLKTKIADLKWQTVLEQIDDVVEAVVAAANQTVVDGLKAAHADGKLTAEERAKVFGDALAAVKAILGTKGLAALQAAIGAGQAELEAYLTAKIEAEVAAGKPVST